MKEHREYLRITNSFRIKYWVISPPGGGAGDSASIDISEGGISIPTSQRLFPGVILELEIYFQKTVNPVGATAEVIWVKDTKNKELPYIMGLKFIKITLRDRDRIYYCIHKLIEKEGRSDIGWID